MSILLAANHPYKLGRNIDMVCQDGLTCLTMGLHDLSKEDGHDDAQEHMLPQNSESPNITFTRRNALKAMFGTMIAAGSASAQKRRTATVKPTVSEPAEIAPEEEGEDKEVDENLVDLPQSLRDAQEAVKEQGLHVINHAWNPNNLDEAFLRLRSAVPPNGRKLQPVMIATAAQAVNGGAVGIPLARDIVDQSLAGVEVNVVTANGTPFTDYTVEIVESKSVDGVHYHNPFLFLKFTKGGPVVEIRVLNWVNVPEYPPVDSKQALHALNPAVKAAVITAANLPYNGSVITWNINEMRNGGDCTSKAALARHTARSFGANNVEIVSGYAHRSAINAHSGGRHVINFVADSTNGAFTFDAGSPQSYTIGPFDKFIATDVGRIQDFDIPGFKRLDGCSAYYDLTQITRNGKRMNKGHHSIPGFGKYGAPLMRTRPSPEVVKYAEELWAFRQSYAYGVDPRLAQRP